MRARVHALIGLQPLSSVRTRSRKAAVNASKRSRGFTRRSYVVPRRAAPNRHECLFASVESFSARGNEKSLRSNAISTSHTPQKVHAVHYALCIPRLSKRILACVLHCGHSTRAVPRRRLLRDLVFCLRARVIPMTTECEIYVTLTHVE